MAPLVAEELLVLAYHPDGLGHGRAIELDCGLAGAILLDLAVSDAVDVIDGRVRATAGAGGPVHPELAAALDRIGGQPDRPPQWWVRSLAGGLRRRLLARLVSDGVLVDETYRWIGVFTKHRFPECDPRPREDALCRLQAAVIDPGSTDARTAALATMVRAARLVPMVFGAGDGPAVQRRLAEITAGNWATEAVREAVAAVYAATVTAAVAAGAGPH